jgi:hypothetical protein
VAGGGGSGDGGGLTAEGQAALEAFQNGDHSDAVIKTLIGAGYTQKTIEENGYTGNYFKKDPGKPTPAPAAQTGLPDFGSSAVATVNAGVQNGHSPQEVITAAKKDLASGKITQKQYNAIVDAALRFGTYKTQ